MTVNEVSDTLKAATQSSDAGAELSKEEHKTLVSAVAELKPNNS